MELSRRRVAPLAQAAAERSDPLVGPHRGRVAGFGQHREVWPRRRDERPDALVVADLTLGREARGEPRRLAVGVVGHVLETQLFEPARGSGGEVSGEVEAVDDDRPITIEGVEGGAAGEPGERQVDGTGEVFGLVLLGGQDLDQLEGAAAVFLEESAKAVGVDRPGHGVVLPLRAHPYDAAMAAEVRPVELAEVLDVAERPRATGWSLRAALVRYAQPQPQRASDLIELVRRIESALRPFAKVLEREGPAIWAAVSSPSEASAADGVDPKLVALVRALAELDRIGDELSAWAVEARSENRPDAALDATVADVTARLEELGVAREERPRPPPGARSRG